jgi:hypothetical protein
MMMAAAVQRGRLLALTVRAAGSDAGKADNKARKRAGSEGAFLCLQPDDKALVVADFPASASLPGDYLLVSLEEACATAGHYVRALEPREPPAANRTSGADGEKQRRGPELVGLRGTWRMVNERKESGEWHYYGRTFIRDLATLREVLAAHGLTLDRQDEAGSAAGKAIIWLAEWRFPPDWSVAQRDALLFELALNCDPV